MEHNQAEIYNFEKAVEGCDDHPGTITLLYI